MMIRHGIIILCLLLNWFQIEGQTPTADIIDHSKENQFSHIEMSILTCGTGSDLYTLFGHSALLVRDNSSNVNLVYNWGTFDFGENNFTGIMSFGANFLRGQLPYALSVSQLDSFLREYQYYKRPVREQVINFTDAQKGEVLKILEINRKPDNRYYKYDFYFDNCVTRLRDIIEGQKGPVNYPVLSTKEKTFRHLLHENLGDFPWTKFGMDIILGTQSDQVADHRGQMFLPLYFEEYLSGAKSDDGSIVVSSKEILTFEKSSNHKGWWTPYKVFLILLIIELIGFFLIYISGDNGVFKYLDPLWFFALTFSGFFFLFMWFATDHTVCANNWNLLWASPASLLYFVKSKKIRKFCFLLTLFLSLIVLLGWKTIPQQMPIAIIPLAIISILKSVRHLGFAKWVDSFRNMRQVVTVLLLATVTLTGQGKISGVTVVSPPSPFEKDPYPAVQKIHPNWVSLVPYGMTPKGQPQVNFGSNQYWWGEGSEGITESIELAKKNGLKIMLKPQIWIRGGWVGDMDFDNESDWLTWEKDYRAYIMSFVNIAIQNDVELICVGTEFRLSVQKREAFWRSLIKDIREIYTGQLTYSSNWDSYQKVPIWDVLDFVGISAYFPLSDMDTPPTMLLTYRWRKHVKQLRKFSEKHDRPILFTEYGYLSVDGAAGKTWELEKKVHSLNINEQAQANGYEALFTSFWNEDFWAGGFLWKWFPNGQGHEGYPERDYTPQNKIAESVLKNWYGK